MADRWAPLVFINGADTKAAQIFTLAHELVHVWLGESALSDVALGTTSANATERWCNEVAAEMLVPAQQLQEAQSRGPVSSEVLDRLARRFKVSTLVIVGRLREVGRLTWDQYHEIHEREVTRVLAALEDRSSGAGGGNFYNTLPVRVSRRFARALVTSALEGETLYRDALQMLGIKSVSTFRELGHKLGVA